MITLDRIKDEVAAIEEKNRKKNEAIKELNLKKETLIKRGLSDLLLFLGVDESDPNWTVTTTPIGSIVKGYSLGIHLDFQKLGSVFITTDRRLCFNDESNEYFWDKPRKETQIDSQVFTNSEEAQEYLIEVFAKKFYYQKKNVL
jgi:hypothetical protein